MSILTILTSPFVINIFMTIVIAFPLPLLLNYTVLQYVPNYGFQIVIVCIFIITFILGSIISYSTSVRECNRYKKRVVLNQGLKQGLYSALIFLVVFFIPFFKSGFTDIGGDTLFWNSIGEGFILGMSNIAITIANFFISKNKGCKLSSEEAEKAYQKIESKLSSRKKKKSPKTVTVTE